MKLRELVCKAVGHDLMTSVHAKRSTLYCARCRTVRWWLDENTGLILSADCTREDLARIVRPLPSGGTVLCPSSKT